MKKTIRICHVTSNLYGAGGHNRIWNFARGCDRARFDVLVVVVGRGDLDQLERYGSTRWRFKEARVEVVGLDAPVWSDELSRLRPTAVLSGSLRVASLTARLALLVKKRRIDVLDLNGDPPLALGFLAARLTGVPTVATVFDNLFWDRPLWRPLGRYLLSRTNAMVSDSQQRSAMIQRWLPERSAPPRVVRNGIAPPLSGLSKAEARSRLGLPNDRRLKVVAQISRLMASKGQLVLVEAMSRVLARFPDAFLLLCGYRAPRDRDDFVAELQRKARSCGVAGRLLVTSYPGDIADVWAAVDIHAHPSLRDSSPIAVIEGMALGKPSVVSSEGGIPELVVNEQTGLVVPPGNATALGAAILRYLEDPGLGDRMGRAARERYLARHRQELMVGELEALFSGLVAEHSRESARESAHG